MRTPSIDKLDPAITRRQFTIALRGLYPACPQYHRGSLVKRFRRKPRQGRLLSVVAAVVENWVRHNLTIYERLLYAREDDPSKRENARKAVSARVAAIVTSWQAGSAAEDPAYKAVRQTLHEQRLSQGPSPGVTASENVAIVEALARWLKGSGEAVSRYEAPLQSARGVARTAKGNGLVQNPPDQGDEETP